MILVDDNKVFNTSKTDKHLHLLQFDWESVANNSTAQISPANKFLYLFDTVSSIFPYIDSVIFNSHISFTHFLNSFDSSSLIDNHSFITDFLSCILIVYHDHLWNSICNSIIFYFTLYDWYQKI